jgi:hypothetical protein
MSYIKLTVSNDTKYIAYHIIVFAMFIITCIKLYTKIDTVTIFVLFVILIQLLLFCCINTSNYSSDILPCCYFLIAFTSVSTSVVFIPYVIINLHDIKNSINAIYFIALCFYIPTVLWVINWYYVSSTKFTEIYCWCYSPNRPTLPTAAVSINLPPVPILSKNDYCTICVEPFNPSRKRMELNCSHILCNTCLNRVIYINNKCPFCCTDIKGK